MSLLVVLEHDRGALAEASLEALTAGRDLAAKLDTALDAVIVAPPGDASAGPTAAWIDEAGRYGAETVHVVVADQLIDYGPDAAAASVLQLADDTDADAVLAAGTDRGNEVLAQIAARADAPFVANALAVDVGDPWSITRVQWGGSLLEDVQLSSDRPLLTVAHHGVAAEPAVEPVEPAVAVFEPELDEADLVTMVCDRDVLSQGVTLATAPVVVSGGRGVGSAEGFEALEELAGMLGGVVGCSRAVTNNGWRPHTDQVGQTGTRIAPDIYIAAGISGAIQHWVGAMASKRILAINTDPEANMVAKADYAVIADLHEIIPAISAEIRRRRS
ncbi:MAG: electron transfer flavoprotein subunit alpha/FixB family protein [Acidimicrobiia bacterium]|nr:electron transfer flavoprotein subunit alpha/FixB family protein [Acidimicrobiia bacterium]